MTSTADNNDLNILVSKELKQSTSSSSDTNTDPKYKGVRKRKWGKWVSEIRLPNSRERIWLGSYNSAEKAARAFDAAQFCLRGSRGSFNFPDNLPINISTGQSMTPQEIQAAAARFANEEVIRTSSEEPESSNVMVCASSDDGAVQGMDWSFLDTLEDCNNGVNSDYGVYGGIGDFGGDYYPPPPEEELDCGMYGEDTVFSTQPSFLWNF